MHTPTREQANILQAFQTGESLLVEALAGTGKTTTMRMLAESTDRKGLYVCYNKAAADEASASFPKNVECRTAHSLAYRAVGHLYRDRLYGSERRPPWKVASWLGVTQDFKLNADVSLTPMFIAGLVQDTIKYFCYSSDDKIGKQHVPFVKGAEEQRVGVVNLILPLARKAWDDLVKPSGYLQFQHDHYLKLYGLKNPKLNYDFIIMDEAQDANGVVAGIFSQQTGTQQIAVGDRYQSLYAWRGAVNFVKMFQPVHHLYLSKSFRFGPAVAQEGQKWLDLLGSDQELEGFEQIKSVVGPASFPNAILCRTNTTVVMEAIRAKQNGQSFAIVGGVDDLTRLAKAARDLQNGKRTLHPDVAVFTDWESVQRYSLTSEGADLRTFVNLIDQYGVEAIEQVAKASVSETKADVTISTAHRSKGREWKCVRIADDFLPTVQQDGSMNEAVMMLAYVAVTRAQERLDRSGLDFVDILLSGKIPVGAA